MKLGISCAKILSLYGVENGLKLIKESGFDAVDVSFTGCGGEGGIYNKSEDEFLTYFSNLKKTCDKYGLEISQTHGRLTTCVPDEKESDEIKRISALDIKASAVLGAPYCIFHNAKLRQFEDVCIDGDFIMAKNKEFFEGYLTPICKEHNVKFALETHGRTILSTGSVLDFLGDGFNLRKSFDEINSDYKAFCLDTGHTNEALYYGGPSVVDTIKALGKDIKTLHLHDNQGFYDSHLMPLVGAAGAIDWASAFEALDEVGYDGVYNWELNLNYYGNYLDKSLGFIGGFLRHFTENKGKI